MGRQQGWEGLLADYIDAARRIEFRWGDKDCVLWCVEWVRLATGRDLSPGLAYGSEEEALALLERLGYGSVADLATAYLPEISPKLAQRGDLLLYPTTACLGICAGTRGFFLTEKGVIAAETIGCQKAWKV